MSKSRMGLSFRQAFFLHLRNIILAKNGEKVKDKVRITICAFLDLYPRTSSITPFIERIVLPLQNILIRSTLMKYGNNKFYFKDFGNVCFLSPDYEPSVKNYLTFKKGDVFVDVGANVGLYAIMASKAVGPKGVIVAIEPNYENFGILKKNIIINNVHNVRVFNVAAWSKRTELKLYISSFSGMHSVKKDYGLGYNDVLAAPVDEILRDINIRKLDLVKIDVEGAEWSVLMGLNETIKMYNPTMIIEIWEGNKLNFERIMNFLKHNGYLVKKIDSINYFAYPSSYN